MALVKAMTLNRCLGSAKSCQQTHLQRLRSTVNSALRHRSTYLLHHQLPRHLQKTSMRTQREERAPSHTILQSHKQSPGAHSAVSLIGSPDAGDDGTTSQAGSPGTDGVTSLLGSLSVEHEAKSQAGSPGAQHGEVRSQENQLADVTETGASNDSLMLEHAPARQALDDHTEAWLRRTIDAILEDNGYKERTQKCDERRTEREHSASTVSST